LTALTARAVCRPGSAAGAAARIIRVPEAKISAPLAHSRCTADLPPMPTATREMARLCGGELTSGLALRCRAAEVRAPFPLPRVTPAELVVHALSGSSYDARSSSPDAGRDCRVCPHRYRLSSSPCENPDIWHTVPDGPSGSVLAIHSLKGRSIYGTLRGLISGIRSVADIAEIRCCAERTPDRWQRHNVISAGNFR
jgi:hypothetical protein